MHIPFLDQSENKMAEATGGHFEFYNEFCYMHYFSESTEEIFLYARLKKNRDVLCYGAICPSVYKYFPIIAYKSLILKFRFYFKIWPPRHQGGAFEGGHF